MLNLERRLTPRMAVEGLSYVNLEADNGGIILNISEGGLCFQSNIPVQQPTTIRIWLVRQGVRAEGQAGRTNDAQTGRGSSRFIESGSELSWTDAKRKTGGLRFTNMPAEAREEIRVWISQNAARVNTGHNAATKTPVLVKTTSPNAKRPGMSALKQSTIALLERSRNTVAPRRLNGFSGGLVKGIVVSALAGAGYLLATHRSELGNSLIQMGERIGGNAVAESKATTTQAALPEPARTAPVLVPQPESIVPELPITREKPAAVKVESATPGKASALTASVILPAVPASLSGTATGNAPPVVTPAEPAVSDAPLDSSSVVPSAGAPKTESGIRPTIQTAPSRGVESGLTSEKFLDVGQFNERVWANKTTEQLSLAGYHTAVVEKGAFWKKSFHVLVGPYGSEEAAEEAHKTLTSRGFTPRSFERGVKRLTLPSGLKLDGKFIPSGDCVIHWESYMPDAFVKFEDERGMGITVEGKWVKRDGRHDQDAIVYTRNNDGSRTLVELRLSGRGQVLVFGKGRT